MEKIEKKVAENYNVCLPLRYLVSVTVSISIHSTPPTFI